MIAGLPLDYAQARAAARIGQRPDERAWLQAHSARSVAALLEAVRASAAAATVSGVEARAGADSIERAFRQQLRQRIVEVARWAPQQWRAAVLWLQHLIDLPALAQLLGAEPPAAWMASDPVLGELARSTPAERRTRLMEGELAPIVRALASAAPGAAPAPLHAALSAWRSGWHARWPDCPADEHFELGALERAVEVHLQRFVSMPADQTNDARSALAMRALRSMHRNPGQPVALFAYLLVVAIDLERLRGEFARRAIFSQARP
ncbi:MAG: hypothetical protein ACM3PU_10695 [Gemmatimonadota bacterium]